MEKNRENVKLCGRVRFQNTACRNFGTMVPHTKETIKDNVEVKMVLGYED